MSMFEDVHKPTLYLEVRLSSLFLYVAICNSAGKPTKLHIIVAIICAKLLHIVFGIIRNKTTFNTILVCDG